MEEMWYDKEGDVLNIEVKKGEYWKSIELPNDIVIDVAKDGSITSIEIARASQIFSGDARRVISIAKPVTA